VIWATVMFTKERRGGIRGIVELLCQTGDSLDASLPTSRNDDAGQNSSRLPVTLY
jgi:hypothetical protein